MGRSAANGYGKYHRRLRADYVRRMQAGEQFTCWRCGKWINPAADWDLGHDDVDRSLYRGPEHVHCNRSSQKRTPGQLKSVRWRGKVVRRCVICGKEFRPGSYSQRSCGRTCGIELQRRNRPPRPMATRTCVECGREFAVLASSTQATCGRQCAGRSRSRYRKNAGVSGRPKPKSGWDALLEKNREVRK
jgi:hypothetical protein